MGERRAGRIVSEPDTEEKELLRDLTGVEAIFALVRLCLYAFELE